MYQLQGLGNEFDIHQPAGRIFQVPDIAAGKCLGHAHAHVPRIGNYDRGVARLCQPVADFRRNLRLQRSAAPRSAARASAPYVPRSSFRWRDIRRSSSGLRRPGPCCRWGAAAYPPRITCPPPSAWSGPQSAAAPGARNTRAAASAWDHPTSPQPAARHRRNTRSRSELAVISRPPNLPIATTANPDPAIRPALAASASSTLGNSPAITHSAISASAGPAASALATPSTICTPTRKIASRAKRRAPSSTSS